MHLRVILYVCVCVCVCVCIYVCMIAFMVMYMYESMYTCLNVYVFVCACEYKIIPIHMHLNLHSFMAIAKIKLKTILSTRPLFREPRKKGPLKWVRLQKGVLKFPARHEINFFFPFLFRVNPLLSFFVVFARKTFAICLVHPTRGMRSPIVS